MWIDMKEHLAQPKFWRGESRLRRLRRWYRGAVFFFFFYERYGGELITEKLTYIIGILFGPFICMKLNRNEFIIKCLKKWRVKDIRCRCKSDFCFHRIWIGRVMDGYSFLASPDSFFIKGRFWPSFCTLQIHQTNWYNFMKKQQWPYILCTITIV